MAEYLNPEGENRRSWDEDEEGEPRRASTVPTLPTLALARIGQSASASSNPSSFSCRRWRNRICLALVGLLLGLLLATRLQQRRHHYRGALPKIVRDASVLDPDAMDWLIKNYLIHHRGKIVEDLQKNLFAQGGPVATALDGALGARLTLRHIKVDATEPQFNYLSMNLTRRSRLPSVYMDIDLNVRSTLHIELEALRHAGVLSHQEVDDEDRGYISSRMSSLVRNLEGEDYILNFQIQGHVEGRAKIHLAFKATEQEPFPKPIHMNFLDGTDLAVVLHDYVVSHNTGFGRWIKRLHLLPLNLLQYVATNEMRKFLEMNRRGWPLLENETQLALERERFAASPAGLNIKLQKKVQTLEEELRQKKEDVAGLLEEQQRSFDERRAMADDLQRLVKQREEAERAAREEAERAFEEAEAVKAAARKALEEAAKRTDAVVAGLRDEVEREKARAVEAEKLAEDLPADQRPRRQQQRSAEAAAAASAQKEREKAAAAAQERLRDMWQSD
eukprot:TRINITY_DN19919_c0_g1_i1.p1 TRINITY_DN19919_c0_g1~~TRINITY_DN19919_c0_g1_i1.p1  ORF type:complete len:504 (-),score=143.26 TRINITY_DN19919_c0_g1_i1:433-1944(-)